MQPLQVLDDIFLPDGTVRAVSAIKLLSHETRAALFEVFLEVAAQIVALVALAAGEAVHLLCAHSVDLQHVAAQIARVARGEGAIAHRAYESLLLAADDAHVVLQALLGLELSIAHRAVESALGVLRKINLCFCDCFAISFIQLIQQ